MLLRRAFKASALKNLIKSVFSELFALVYKSTCCCRPDKEPTSMDNQLSQNFLAWPFRSKSPLLPDYPQMVFQEKRDIMVDNHWLYAVEYEVLVFGL